MDYQGWLRMGRLDRSDIHAERSMKRAYAHGTAVYAILCFEKTRKHARSKYRFLFEFFCSNDYLNE